MLKHTWKHTRKHRKKHIKEHTKIEHTHINSCTNTHKSTHKHPHLYTQTRAQKYTHMHSTGTTQHTVLHLTFIIGALVLTLLWDQPTCFLGQFSFFETTFHLWTLNPSESFLWSCNLIIRRLEKWRLNWISILNVKILTLTAVFVLRKQRCSLRPKYRV